jgi:uncharacterized repeat protein (TIGR03803 family)
MLYSLSPSCMADGAVPQAGLIQDAAGNLYGTTRYGGTYNSGVVFKLSSAAHQQNAPWAAEICRPIFPLGDNQRDVRDGRHEACRLRLH